MFVTVHIMIGSNNTICSEDIPTFLTSRHLF